MPSHFISSAAAVQAIVVTLVLIVLSIIVSGILGSLGFLGLVAWLLLLGGVAVGLFLILRGGRPLAGVGAILMPLSIWISLYTAAPPLQLLPFIWTGLYFIGAFLIAWGTRADTIVKRAWPITLLRVVVGWAWVSQGVDHFMNNWLPDGGNYLQSATTGASRAPIWPLDPLYQNRS